MKRLSLSKHHYDPPPAARSCPRHASDNTHRLLSPARLKREPIGDDGRRKDMRTLAAVVVRMTLVVVVGLSATACAEDVPPIGPVGVWTPSPGVPTNAVLTCRSNGSAELSTDVVQTQPDGVHVIVENEYDEPVSVEGFDADPGRTRWVFSRGPGTMRLMCWPFSQHTSGEEPQRHELTVVDLSGLYVDGSVACEFDGFSTGSYAEVPVDEGPPPMNIVRNLVSGVLPDDVLRVDGYPEQEGGSVLVVRDGEVVASYSIGRFKGESWTILGASVCDGTGLQFEGESFH